MGWWSGTWPKYDQSLPLSMACYTFRVPFLKFKFWFSMMRVNSQVLTPTLLAHSAIALSISTVSTMGTVIVQPAQMKTILPATLAFLGAQRARPATKVSFIHVNIGSLRARDHRVALLPSVPWTTIFVTVQTAQTKRPGIATIAHSAAAVDAGEPILSIRNWNKPKESLIHRRQSTVLGSSSTWIFPFSALAILQTAAHPPSSSDVP